MNISQQVHRTERSYDARGYMPYNVPFVKEYSPREVETMNSIHSIITLSLRCFEKVVKRHIIDPSPRKEEDIQMCDPYLESLLAMLKAK
jgi:hypothetical protein